MADDGEARPSEQAQGPASHSPKSTSDPGPSDAPKKSGCLIKLLTAMAIAATFYGLYWIVVEQLEVFAGDSEGSNDSATVSTVTGQGAATNESGTDTDGSASAAEGSISGTWAMYWQQSDNVAFEITFTGTDTGTLEILNDDTETDTGFEVEGDQVSFKFTRAFEVPVGTWPEKSTFEGTLTGLHEMTGVWARQGWECWPAPDAGCKHTDWSQHPARLIRISE